MREFTAKDAKFFLNGKRVRIFCGNVTTQGAWDRWDSGNLKSREDLRRQKSQGANAVRYHMAGADSHKFLAMCDEEGILAASEFPMFHRVFSELTFTGAPRKEFMDNTLYEWKERLLRDYNHPSCALWSLSNEVWTDSTADELNELYDALKPMDKQNRPMSADSGAHSFGIPTLPLHTDFWDAHLYNVLSYLPPALAYKDFDRYYEDLKKIYGNLSKPSAAFEAVEFAGHKPPQIIPAERNLSADEYLELLKACPWGDKNVTGLRYYLAWAGNGAVFADKVAKETFEEFRKETRLQAIHPWFGPRTYICPSYKIISNPVFIGAARLPGNQFAGKPFAFDIVIVKDDLGKASADVTLTLAGKNGDVMAVRDFKFELPENQDKTTGAVAIDIPPRTESGACRIFLDVKTDRGGSNRNYYDINILNPKDLPELKPGAGKIALVEPDQKAAETFAKIFDRFAVGYERVNSVERLPDFTHLLINTGAEGKTLWEELSQKHGGKIHDWVTKGGRLLINEVPVSSSLDFIFDGYSVKKSSGTDLVSAAMEPVIREHPVFKGLSFESFEHMSGDGIVADSLISPLSPNILATAPVYGKDGGMLMCEAKIGKGSCLVSQVRALERSGKDSSAALLLRNMLGYFTGPELCKEVKELKKNEKTGLLLFYDKLDKGDFQPLDISGAANRSFRDDTAGDGKGGWTDAGGSDLRHAPSGEQKYFGIPFNIIPSPSESDRAVIILKSQRTPSFPEKSTPVKIGGKIRRLFLLHTAMYPENGSAAYTITVNYADGSKSEIPVIAADSIGDWFNPRNQKNALTAWAERHPLINFPFGFYLACFDIPEPGKTVGSVEFSNKDGGATPVIIAATAQKYNELAENVLGKSWSFSDKDNVRLMGTKTTRPEPGKFEGAEHFWLAPDLKGASIDASKWKRLMFRMRSSAPVSVKILYIAGADNATSQTLSPVRTDKDGWQYFDTDLGSSSLVWPHGSSVQARQWGGASKKISSFGIDIYPKEITTVEFGPVTLFKD
jgi:beta-galactosidase